MKCFIVLVSVALSWTLEAQVPNNNIINRLHLSVDTPAIISSTANASVEWECINKSLTNKCLIYHNDQWFDFSVPTGGVYYLNISSQQCKQNYGVQMVVIEGNPCETRSYKVLACLSQIRQDDVFIKLDSLKPETLYLVNIDGFLGDHCDFQIELRTKPAGLPLKAEGGITQVSQETRFVRIGWDIDQDSIRWFEMFKVYRRRGSESKAVMVDEQNVGRFNAYGFPVLHYETQDSLPAGGIYSYLVYGIQAGTLVPILLSARKINYDAPHVRAAARPQRIINLKVSYPDKANFELIVYDVKAGATLLKSKRQFNVADTSLNVDVGEFLDKGVTSFLILLSDPNSREPKEFYYHVGINGQLVRE
jgi:hypothetical protein